MLPVKNLIKGLIEFVEQGTFPFKPGILRDPSGGPILDIEQLLLSDATAIGTTKEQATMLLRYCATGDLGRVDEIINAQGVRRYSLFSYTDGTAIMVPSIASAEELPFAVMALARMADTGSGDSIAHRISQCLWCGKFFLCKTKKRSRFHIRACRIKHMNRERLQSGWFKEYYLRVKDRREAERHAAG